MRQWCLLVKRRSRGLRVRRTHSLHWIVRVCSRLVHEVAEVTKLLGSLYLCGCFLREQCDACNLQHHGVRQWCPSQVSNSRIVLSVWKSRMMQDETRHCEMMQDGVAELLSFLLPSFVKLVFCWCVQPSVCRSLRQWFFAMVKLMSGVLSLEVREQMLCSGLCNSAATSIVYLFTSFLGSDVNVETRCIVHRVNIHILICTLNVRETSDDWQTGIFNISCASRGFCWGCPWDLENCIVTMSVFVDDAVDLCDV